MGDLPKREIDPNRGRLNSMATSTCIPMNPIGYMKSVFSYKNGTPRQPSLCPFARGTLTLDKSLFTNPEHSLEDLEEFSHVWVIFVFHKNNNKFTKAKVKPPRLNGRRVGVFSTRSPYRPNPIGLTLAKLDKIHDSTVYLSGIDLLDGTPVIDIKPYIPSYDVPNNNPKLSVCDSDLSDCCETKKVIDENQSDRSTTINDEVIKTDSSQYEEDARVKNDTNFDKSSSSNANEKIIKGNQTVTKESYFMKEVSEEKILVNNEPEYSQPDLPSAVTTKTADWLMSPPVNTLNVRFTHFAMEQLKQYSKSSNSDKFHLRYLKSCDEVLKAISDILCQDPRSVYRRKHCVDSLYYFVVDTVHVTAWFDSHVAEVVRIQPVSDVEYLQIHQ